MFNGEHNAMDKNVQKDYCYLVGKLPVQIDLQTEREALNDQLRKSRSGWMINCASPSSIDGGALVHARCIRAKRMRAQKIAVRKDIERLGHLLCIPNACVRVIITRAIEDITKLIAKNRLSSDRLPRLIFINTGVLSKIPPATE